MRHIHGKFSLEYDTSGQLSHTHVHHIICDRMHPTYFKYEIEKSLLSHRVNLK